MLYRRLDRLREEAGRRLAGLLRQAGGTPQERSQRDTTTSQYAERIAQYDAVEHGLCFGRLDAEDGECCTSAGWACSTGTTAGTTPRCCWTGGPRRPGRSTPPPPGPRRACAGGGGSAPRAAPSSTSTTRSSTVDGVDEAGLTGEAALLAAVTAGRGERMRDIVATLQAEQDRIDPLRAARRARGGRRAGHRQDRGRPAPRGLPALHPSPPARPGRTHRQPEPTSCGSPHVLPSLFAEPVSSSPRSAISTRGSRHGGRNRSPSPR